MGGKSSRSRGRVHLLHGWGGAFRQTWGETGWVDRLEHEGYEVCGLQLLGHGVPTGPHSPADYAGIADLIESELQGVESGIAIGYSLGAKILLEMSCRHPEMFRRLVLVGIGVNAFKPLGASAALADCLRNGLPKDAPADLSRLIGSVLASGNDPLAMAACITRPQDQPITALRLKAVRCPTLIVNGSSDRFVLPQEPLVDALPDAVGVLLEGLDHMDVLTSTESLERSISFID